MKKNFTHYYFLISCPGDVQCDIPSIMEVVSTINKEVGDPNHVYFETMFWKDDAIPAAGNSAQEIINKQLLEKADGVIALFWTRFGTPTDFYGSGTEEEIVKAINDDKDVLLYCSNKPIEPDKMDNTQYSQVVNFKKRYNGLFSTYGSSEELKTKLQRALTSLVFKYAKAQNNRDDLLSNIESEKGFQYSLAEYFDLGWYLSRSHLDVPDDSDSSTQHKIMFNSRMNMLLNIINSLQLLNAEEINLLSDYQKRISKLGMKEYIATVGKETYERVHGLLNSCIYGLMKKLKNKDAISFQFGLHYGRYLLIIELEWLEDNRENKVFVRGLQNSFSEANNTYQKMLNCANRIDTKMCEKLKDIQIDGNLDLTVFAYHDKLGDTAEEIMSELQMY